MKWFILILIITALPATYIMNKRAKTNVEMDASVAHRLILSEDSIYGLEIFNSEEQRVKGLSGRDHFDGKKGALFVFEKKGYYGMWMKDMNVSIDIIWMNEAYKIVHLISEATPESYPHIFYPDSPALYVLELPSGTIMTEQLEKGLVLNIDY